MILNAKEILKQLYNCCDLIEERLLDGDEKPGCDLRKQLLKDTASFAARVSARKTITEAEASFLNALTGRKKTRRKCGDLSAVRGKAACRSPFGILCRRIRPLCADTQ